MPNVAITELVHIRPDMSIERVKAIADLMKGGYFKGVCLDEATAAQREAYFSIVPNEETPAVKFDAVILPDLPLKDVKWLACMLKKREINSVDFTQATEAQMEVMLGVGFEDETSLEESSSPELEPLLVNRAAYLNVAAITAMHPRKGVYILDKIRHAAQNNLISQSEFDELIQYVRCGHLHQDNTAVYGWRAAAPSYELRGPVHYAFLQLQHATQAKQITWSLG